MPLVRHYPASWKRNSRASGSSSLTRVSSNERRIAFLFDNRIGADRVCEHIVMNFTVITVSDFGSKGDSSTELRTAPVGAIGT